MLELPSSEAFWLIVAVTFMMAAAYVATIVVASRTEGILKEAVVRGALLQLGTVSCIVLTVACLGLVEKLESSEVSTVLAGIAGYVLGALKVSEG